MSPEPEPNPSAARPHAPVVVVTGPTASGKTETAIAIARRFGGEVVNADSMQVYRYLDIGTAKPSLEERARVPHHLFDVVDPGERYDAGRYVREARAVARAIHEAGRVVVLCGGTGLYIRAFLEGLVDAGGADAELREQLEAEHEAALAEQDPDRLHRRLAELDPVAARRIHPGDVRRVVRALEIAAATGRSPSRIRDEHRFADRPYTALHLALDPGREPLDVRIDARCRAMIDAGLLREVRELRRRGYGGELRPMQAIGYRHMQPVVDGADTLANALEAMQRDTRRFARRQRTWLRRVPQAVWMDGADASAPLRAAEAFLVRGEGGEAREG